MDSRPAIRLLLVEDEALIALVTSRKLRNFGYEVLLAPTGEAAVALAAENPDLSLILMDIDLGAGMGGPEAAREILATRRVPIVFLTSHAEREMVDLVRGITRYGYVLKSSGDFVLRSSIEMALELHAAVTEIAHRLEREESLMAERRTLLVAIEQSPLAIVITDAEAKIEYVNPRFTELTGFCLDEVRGQNPRVLQSGATDPETYRELWTRIVGGRAWQGYFLNRRKDGRTYCESAVVAPVVDAQGRIQNYIALKNDLEANLDDRRFRGLSDLYFRSFFQGNPAIMLAVEPASGRIVDANPAALAFYSYPRADLIGMPISDINVLPPEEVRAARERARTRVENVFEFVHRRADGSRIPVRVHSSPVLYRGEELLLSVIQVREGVALDRPSWGVAGKSREEGSGSGVSGEPGQSGVEGLLAEVCA